MWIRKQDIIKTESTETIQMVITVMSLVLIWIPLWQGELCRRVSTKFTLHVLVAGEGEQDVKVIHSWGRHSHTQAKQTSSCVYYSLNLKRTSLNNTCNLKSQNSPQEDSETKVLWHDTKRYRIRQTPLHLHKYRTDCCWTLVGELVMVGVGAITFLIHEMLNILPVSVVTMILQWVKLTS